MSRIPTNGISTCWMLEMATPNVTVRVVIWWVVDRNTENLKEMRQKENPVVNLVTPVAQALEMAKIGA